MAAGSSVASVAEHRFRVMASDAHVVLVEPAPGAAAFAEDRLRDLEARWSRFIASSEISRLNRSHGAPCRVGPDTARLVTAMLAAHAATGGAYDPTLLHAIVAVGYDSSFDAVTGRCSKHDPDGIDIASTASAELSIGVTSGRIGEIEIDPQGTVTMPAGIGLDPGGLGKGLAADLVVAELLAGHAAGALVGIGGDLACGGEAVEDGGWVVAIEHPDDPATTIGRVVLERGGVATSSTRSRRWVHGGVVRHHVIDPATRVSATTDVASATVVAGTAWLAEAHALAALLVGASGAIAHLRRTAVSGVVIDAAGTISTTDDLAPLATAPTVGDRR